MAMRLSMVSALVMMAVAASGLALADPIELNLTGHKFTPADSTVPANQKFQVKIFNHDDTPAEFESHDLKVEKIVVGGGSISITVGPLKPGTYKFVDDYNPYDAFGTFTAKE